MVDLGQKSILKSLWVLANIARTVFAGQPFFNVRRTMAEANYTFARNANGGLFMGVPGSPIGRNRFEPEGWSIIANHIARHDYARAAVGTSIDWLNFELNSLRLRTVGSVNGGMIRTIVNAGHHIVYDAGKVVKITPPEGDPVSISDHAGIERIMGRVLTCKPTI